jgi:hypothetical protein
MMTWASWTWEVLLEQLARLGRQGQPLVRRVQPLVRQVQPQLQERLRVQPQLQGRQFRVLLGRQLRSLQRRELGEW